MWLLPNSPGDNRGGAPSECQVSVRASSGHVLSVFGRVCVRVVVGAGEVVLLLMSLRESLRNVLMGHCRHSFQSTPRTASRQCNSLKEANRFELHSVSTLFYQSRFVILLILAVFLLIGVGVVIPLILSIILLFQI